MQIVSTCLWFDREAEEVARFYTGIFDGSRILETVRYPEGGPGPVGSVLTVRFELGGTEFTALNGGPHFKHSPAMSMVANCETQVELDRLWDSLLVGGGRPSQCGWLTDRYGVSWQVVPQRLVSLLNTPDKAASQRAFAAMMTMVKLDIAEIDKAYRGD